MSEDTTKTSNDESRKEVNVKHVSEAEIKKHLESWGNIYIAAINPEFAAQVLNHVGEDALEIKVESKAAKYIEELKENSMNMGAKQINTPKAEAARNAAKKASKKRSKEAEEKMNEEISKKESGQTRN